MVTPAIYLVLLLIPIGLVLAIVLFKSRKEREDTERPTALNLRIGEAVHAGSPVAPSARRYAEANAVVDLEAGLSPTGTDSTLTSGMEMIHSLSSVSKMNEPNVIEYLRLHTSPEVEIRTDLECAICLEGYNPVTREFPRSWAARLRCGHTYHHDCIAAWLKKDGSCPLCRHNVSGRSTVRTWSLT